MRYVERFKIWGHPTYFDPYWSQVIYYLLGGLLMCGVATFGIVGNLLSARVLSRYTKAPLNIFLLGLSVCDLIVCLIELFNLGLIVLFKEHQFPYTEWYVRWVCESSGTYMDFVWVVGLTGSTYFNVAATFERFIAVCWPMSVSRVLTYGRTRAVALAIVLFACLYQVLEFVLSHYSSRQEGGRSWAWPHTGAAIYANFSCEYPSGPPPGDLAWLTNVRFWIYGLVMFIIPIACIFIFNVAIIAKILRRNAAPVHYTTSNSLKLNQTKMLIVIIVIFLFCHVLSFIRYILNVLQMEVIVATNFLLTVDSAINYLVYCAFGKSFRTSLLNLFSCRHAKNVQTAGKQGSKTSQEKITTKWKQFSYRHAYR